MARAYASRVIDAPVDVVWRYIRNFDGLPFWHPAVATSQIEGGGPADAVGCIRAFSLHDGRLVREKLLALDDISHIVVYDFQTPAFPVDNYVARMQLTPVTATNACFCEWEATFDEAPADNGVYQRIIAEDVFAVGWRALGEVIARTAGKI